jgi:hypothetical protein
VIQAYPIDLLQVGEHFASGVNTPGEVRGLALSGRHVGITCGQIRPGLLDELALFSGGMLRLFVDSGAFSEVEFGAEGLKVVAPIDHAGWVERFEVYRACAALFGPRCFLVAPDRVGCQVTTLERLARYAPDVAACAALRANIIVPVQKGSMSMAAFYRAACEVLGLRGAPIAGIPMKKDATSLADLADLVASLPWFGARIHLLGLGPESPRFAPVIDLIKSIRPNCAITSDSVTIRRLVGRTNGRGGGPRALTRYQDEARGRGITDPSAIKAWGLQRQGRDELELERDLAERAGWFDVELYDSLEEAITDRRAGFPDTAPEVTHEETPRDQAADQGLGDQHDPLAPRRHVAALDDDSGVARPGPRAGDAAPNRPAPRRHRRAPRRRLQDEGGPMIKLNPKARRSALVYAEGFLDACRQAKVADPLDALIETDAYPRLAKIYNVEWMVGWLHGCAEAHGVKVEALWKLVAPSSSKRAA